jgi:hypothetical protein
VLCLDIRRLERQFNGYSNSLSPIRAAERFWPLLVINSVALVWKNETELECGRWLPRKVRKTVLMQHHDKRRAASEIVVADSRGGTISAFAQA